MAIQRSGSRSSSLLLRTRCGLDGQRLQVDVGLEEAVEQDQAVGPGAEQPLGHVGQRAEERADLDGQRDRDRRPDGRHQVEVLVLDLRRGLLGVGGHEVDVQLQGVGAGLLDQLAVADPAAVGGAVEAADDRDRERLLGLPRQPEVVSGPVL